MFEINSIHLLNSAFKKVKIGILLIILISSKILLLFDKNLIITFGDALNMLKNIPGIFSGVSSKTFKKMLETFPDAKLIDVEE